MPRIQALSPSVINKIAAGEVIERPASAVKELLENSIDALATHIEVDVVAGGMELLRIVDDGEGIHPDDLPLAIASHATSKIRAADDLFDVHTFGFRGEALASIAEVSRFRIRSRQADQSHGSELEVVHGVAEPQRECGCPFGTAIEIRNLFENVPVRRKFLKSASTEFGHISEQFTRMAIAHPRLHMVLRHNDRVVYQLPPVDRPLDRLRVFYGDDLVEQLIRIESEVGGVKLWGYVGHPSVSKATRKQQYLFLNGRWIQDRTLQHALTEAYRGLLMVGRQPVAFLFFELPTDRVDVNVHPTKSEVRFQDAQPLFRQLLAALRSKFLSLDLQSRLTLPTSTTTPGLSLTPSHVARPSEAQRQLETEFAAWTTARLANWSPEEPATLTDAADRGLEELSAPIVETWDTEPTSPGIPHATSIMPATDVVAQTASSTTSLGHSARAMQVHDCYIVVETEEGLTVIDQHALHERILYEQFRERVLSGVVEAQRLLMPLPIELSAKEAGLVLEQAEMLNRLGIGVEEFGKDTVLLTKHPVLLRQHDLAALVRDVAEKLDGPAPNRRDLLDELLHMMSCKAAVKAGQRLSSEEIDALLTQRHLVDDAHHCPHGRPTALKLSRAELDRQFGRLG
ncbi:DNA mismatch repair endonuclease MutL [bacterium]|nr:DNA mismatch repair endonuclease MutL [bacterium]